MSRSFNWKSLQTISIVVNSFEGVNEGQMDEDGSVKQVDVDDADKAHLLLICQMLMLNIWKSRGRRT